MSMSNVLETALLGVIFTATAWANMADNAVVAPLTNIHYALATADPGEAGTMATSEVAYTGYARTNVPRTSGGHTVTANSVSPLALVGFPAGTGGTGTVTHFAQGRTGGGAVDIWFKGTVTPNIVTGNGVTPQLSTATATTLD